MNKRAKKEVEEVARVKTVAAAVAGSFALPSDFHPYRMRNEYSTEETALFHVFEEHRAYPSGGVGGANEQLRDDTHMEMIFQDLLRNRISYVRNPSGSPWGYQWVFRRNASTGAETTAVTINAGTSEVLVPSHANATTTFQPHGPIYFAESDQFYTGMWCDDGPVVHSTLRVSFNIAVTAATGRIVLMFYSNGSWVESASTNLTVGPTFWDFTLGTTGIYAIRVENPNIAVNASVLLSGTCGCWGHFPAPYVVSNAASIESARSLGHSILFRNTAAPLNQQGYITGIQPGKGRFYGGFITGDGLTDIYPTVRDYTGASPSRPLATGMYAFVKPTEEEDLKFRTPFTVSNAAGSTVTNWTCARTPILDTEYVVIVSQCNTAAGRDFVIRTDFSGEFETSNQFFNVDKPRAEPGDWRDGMEALASFQQFYDNPIHWKRILQTLGSIASVGGRISSLFGPKAAAIGMPLSMAGDILKGGFQ